MHLLFHVNVFVAAALKEVRKSWRWREKVAGL
jgi:hypothetical protein